MVVTRATLLANANRHFFQNYETTFMANRFAIKAAFAHNALAVLAGKIIHLGTCANRICQLDCTP